MLTLHSRFSKQHKSPTANAEQYLLAVTTESQLTVSMLSFDSIPERGAVLKGDQKTAVLCILRSSACGGDLERFNTSAGFCENLTDDTLS